jgi:hypothetical protein
VELAGLEPPSKRLFETSDELLFGSSSVSEPQHLLLTRPCDRCIEETGDTDSARHPTIDSALTRMLRHVEFQPLQVAIEHHGVVVDEG